MVNMYETKKIRNKVPRKKIGMITLIAGASLALLGLFNYEYSTKDTYSIENAIYQGYRNNGANPILVFDPESLTQRQGEPDHRLLGNPGELGFDEEDRGKNFNLVVKTMRGLDRIIQATPVSE